MKRQLLLILVLFIVLQFQAQECSSLMTPVSLQERTNEATLIIEGEVINSISYWDTAHKNIYTIHEVTVYKNAKGVNATTVFVETEGGQVDDLIQEVSSAARLRKGYEGVFFLKNSNHSFNIVQTTYKMVAAAQGYIKYDRIDNKASDVFKVYTSIENEVFSKIEQSTNRAIQVVQERAISNILGLNPPTTPPAITNFSPTTITAGTESILTINGSNFGTTQGTVSFKFASDGGSSYVEAEDSQVVSWSDSQIQIEVPSDGGSGTIRVTSATNETGTSSTSLTIPYSHLNSVTNGNVYPTMLQNKNGSGGFSFEYHTDFDTSSAKQYFEEAFGLWNCQSEVNFQLGTAVTTIDFTGYNEVSTVRFDNGSELPSGVIGSVSKFYFTCLNSGKSVVAEMDITWDDGADFYYGNGTPGVTQYDFKTVALHELGHAHQLGHVINSSAVMHYNIGFAEERYSLNSGDVDAANYTMGEFVDPLGCDTNSMTTNNLCPDVPEVTLDPVNLDQCVDSDAVFTITATNAVTYQWQENNGSSWSDITDDATYGGATTTTLTITGITFALNSYQYRCVVANPFDVEVNSGAATLTADEFPISSVAVTAEACGGDTGEITFTFSDSSIRTGIEFSIDGGVSYPHGFSDNIGSGTATNLAGGTYDVWVRWGNNECPLEIEDVTIQTITPPSATVVVVDGAIGANDGKLQFAFTDDASQTNIEFSIDNGATYPYSYDDTIGTAEIIGLSGGDYQVWTRWDDASCPTGLGTYTISEIAYTVIPDANFENALDVLGYDDIAGDGRVPTNLISGVTFLNVQNSNIVNLTGIEDFVALTTLFCHNNSLTTIDTSQNTALTNLRCYSNQIDALNLSTNINLQTLSASPNNLATLDLQFNTALEYVYLNNNDLTTLNLDTCVVLKSLQLSGNNLSSLSVVNGNNSDITDFTSLNNPNLNCISVDNATDAEAGTGSYGSWIKDATASYGGNCDELTYVPDDNFENYLETHDASGMVVSVGDPTSMGNGIANDNFVTTTAINMVTNLTLYNSGIENLKGIEDFLSVSNLRVHNNSLTAVDLSNNINIKKLQLENNVGLTSINISTLTLLKEFWCFNTAIDNLDVSNNTALESLYAYDTALMDLDLSTNVALDYLVCQNNQLTNLDISNNPLLTAVYAGGNNISTLILGTHTVLKAFNVGGNNLDEIDVSPFVALESLYLFDNNFTSIDLKANVNLHTIRVDDNELTELDIRNGNNTAIADENFRTSGNPNLTCINVDEENYANDTWMTYVDNNISSFTVHCNETYVPDDNFENYLETHDADGNNVPLSHPTSMGNGIANDDYVTTVNINTVTILSVTFKSIANLIGIGDFTALEELSCQFNDLEELDLSNNLALTTLSAITNDLTSLDLRNNVNLVSLLVTGNDLTYLNVANGNNGNITSFNAQSNSNLACINVDDVTDPILDDWFKDALTSYGEHCYETNVPDDIFEAYLETHDASGNSVSLGDPASMGNGIDDDDYVSTAAIENVVSLVLQNPPLGPGQVIDPATVVSNLTGLEDFIALVNLDIGFQNIINVDVTRNINLETLVCAASGVTTLDVSTNIQLKSLSIGGNEIETLDITNNTQLRDLFFGDNNITDLDLSHNTLLEVILIYNNQLTSVNLKNGNNDNIAFFNATGNSNLTCILVDNAVDFTADWENFIDAQASFNDVSCDVQLSPKVFLQGALLNPNIGEESLMRDDLRVAGYIDTTSPYDPNSMDASVLAITGDNAIVDWVFIELRDANDNTLVITDTSALLQRDGDIVSFDGVSPVTMGITSGDYYISIKHRNHLGIMTANAISLSDTATIIDFTDANNLITFGTNAQTTFGMPSGVVALWAGDANGDGQLNYLGAASDIPSIRSQVFNDPDNSIFGGPPLGTYQSAGYTETDVNMDGVTVYSGGTSDILFIRDNTFNNPSNSFFGGPPLGTYLFIQQLPEGAN